MKISLAVASPEVQSVQELEVPPGCTVGDAIELASVQKVLDDRSAVGVWGKVRTLGYVLREGDRVELYRPLVADPKTARRKRAGR